MGKKPTLKNQTVALNLLNSVGLVTKFLENSGEKRICLFDITHLLFLSISIVKNTEFVSNYLLLSLYNKLGFLITEIKILKAI